MLFIFSGSVLNPVFVLWWAEGFGDHNPTKRKITVWQWKLVWFGWCKHINEGKHLITGNVVAFAVSNVCLFWNACVFIRTSDLLWHHWDYFIPCFCFVFLTVGCSVTPALPPRLKLETLGEKKEWKNEWKGNDQDLEISSFCFAQVGTTLQWADFYPLNRTGVPSPGVPPPHLPSLHRGDFLLSFFCFFSALSLSCRPSRDPKFQYSVFSFCSTVCSTVKAQLHNMHCSNTLTLVDPILKPFLLLGTDQQAYEKKDKTASWNTVSYWNIVLLGNPELTGVCFCPWLLDAILKVVLSALNASDGQPSLQPLDCFCYITDGWMDFCSPLTFSACSICGICLC